MHPHAQLPGASTQMQAQARRFSRAGVMLIGLILTLLSVVPAAKADIYNPADWAPMVWSDKADYAPGEQVTLTGAHWTAGRDGAHPRQRRHGQQLGPRRRRDRGRDRRHRRPVQPPELVRRPVPRDGHGGSGAVATHTFTDANPQSVQIAPGSQTVARGRARCTPSPFPLPATTVSAPLDLSASGLPAGATATGSKPPEPTRSAPGRVGSTAPGRRDVAKTTT